MLPWNRSIGRVIGTTPWGGIVVLLDAEEETMDFPLHVLKNAIAVTVPDQRLAEVAARKRSWEGYQ